jgi:hypothetical protein
MRTADGWSERGDHDRLRSAARQPPIRHQGQNQDHDHADRILPARGLIDSGLQFVVIAHTLTSIECCHLICCALYGPIRPVDAWTVVTRPPAIRNTACQRRLTSARVRECLSHQSTSGSDSVGAHVKPFPVMISFARSAVVPIGTAARRRRSHSGLPSAPRVIV